jgi:glycosyltransferase involved in cell wall biosynthesis
LLAEPTLNFQSPDLHNADAERIADAQAALDRILRSRFWRTTKPLRVGLSHLPPRMQRPVHWTLRAIWRMLTPQLNALRQDLVGRTPDGARQLLRSPRAASLVPIICYISGEPTTPGATYRVHRYAAACNAIGAHATILHLSDLAAHMAQAERIDLLVIWRAAWTDNLAAFVRAARKAGARVVFDIDDLMIDPALATTDIIDGIRSQGLTETQVQTLYAQLQRTMLAADYCAVSTFELAGHIRRYGKTCFMLPNGFDAKTLQVSRMAARRRLASQPDGLLRIGYATGSRTHQRDFAQIASVLPRILRAHPACRLVLFRTDHARLIDLGDFPDLERLSDQIEWRDLVPLEQLPNEIARFDVNLVPLELDNPFCEAKSELKYFEAALAGVCTVASPVGPYLRAIRNGSNGFLAATPEQWETTLTQLLGDPALRRQVAQTALNTVLWAYGPDRRAQLMRRVLKEWQGGPDGADAFVLELDQRARQANPSPIVPLGQVVFSVDRLQTAEVTVAVPLFNYAHTLIETLESVRTQTLQPLDLIIVDDGSTDRSLEIALEWARVNAGRFNRLLLIRNEENAGLGFTRNAAFSAVETTYVLPLDADNLLRPTCCERLLAAVRGTGAAFAYPVIQEFGGRTGIVGNAPYDPSRFIGGNYVDAMALIARSAWSAVGGYAPMRHGWEDYDFWCALAEVGLFGIAVGGPSLAYYRVHETSMLAQVTDKQDVKDQVIAVIERRHPWVTVARPANAAHRRQHVPEPIGADSVPSCGGCPLPVSGDQRDRQRGANETADYENWRRTPAITSVSHG